MNHPTLEQASDAGPCRSNTGPHRPAQTPPGTFDKIQQLLRDKDPVTWVFTGDSITQGAFHTMGWRSYVEHFAERVRFELKRSRDIVINTGISGNRMTGLVPDAEWRVHRFQPQVVSLMMGMNDCVAGPGGRETYRTELTKFYAMVNERKSLLLLHTPNPIVILDPAKELREGFAGVRRHPAQVCR